LFNSKLNGQKLEFNTYPFECTKDVTKTKSLPIFACFQLESVTTWPRARSVVMRHI